MSLTSHLNDPFSPVTQYLKERFPNPTRLIKEANAHLRSTSTIAPSIPPEEARAYPWGNVGRAVDYRIRYSFGITPSLAFVAAEGKNYACMAATDPGSAFPLVDSFFAYVDAFATGLQPCGRKLSAEDEVALAKICFVLGWFEQCFRTGEAVGDLVEVINACSGELASPTSRKGTRMPPAPVRIDAGTQQRVADILLRVVSATWAADIARIAQVFTEQHLPLAMQPARLNPTFLGSGDVGGADADLIVDGCLIDIKTTKEPRLTRDMLYQLLGYVLLDYNDRYHVNSVGIYMARQGSLCTWPLKQFLCLMADDDSVNVKALRKEFRAVVA